MPIFSKESLESLRRKIDLVEVISPYVDLKRAGASFKGVCPFHDEKTPSFMIQKGDSHYHCFGCGAHGDAIQFLMDYQKLNFSAAIETLAEKFHITLEIIEGKSDYQGPSKKLLKEALEKASRFFQFHLLHTPEGHQALEYLFRRGISLDFISQFHIGFAPSQPGMLRKFLHEQGVEDEAMEHAGLIVLKSSWGYREFFADRITFPIQQASGEVIGFSARKYKEETFGGKYINTSETPLFKKSRVLFGLNYSRRRIAKEGQAIIVEGQIDALRLIYEGFNCTVAGQGTAFGEGHLQELLNLGVSQVCLALDSDAAGIEAAIKVGNLFQREGVEVRLANLPPGNDPDSFLRKEGKERFRTLLLEARPYLDFLVEFYAGQIKIDTPAGKNEIAQTLTRQIREWKHPLMVHESLKKLSHLLQIPEHMIGIGQEYVPNLFIRKSSAIGLEQIDPNRILEMDFLRWLLLGGAHRTRFILLAQNNIKPEFLMDGACRRIYAALLQHASNGMPFNSLSLVEQEEDQELLSTINNKKINVDRAEENFLETLQKILDRNWMERREELRRKIQCGQCSDDEAIDLMKEFEVLKKSQPLVSLFA